MKLINLIKWKNRQSLDVFEILIVRGQMQSFTDEKR